MNPINADCRQQIEEHVLKAYRRELERSAQPGYVAPILDGEDFEIYDDLPGQSHEARPQWRGVEPAQNDGGSAFQ